MPLYGAVCFVFVFKALALRVWFAFGIDLVEWAGRRKVEWARQNTSIADRCNSACNKYDSYVTTDINMYSLPPIKSDAWNQHIVNTSSLYHQYIAN